MGRFQEEKYTKKPITITAIQYLRDENIGAVQMFFKKYNSAALSYDAEANEYRVKTLEGNSYVLEKGDYIIRGVKGEFYPCKPDVFWQTYTRDKKVGRGGVMKNKKMDRLAILEYIDAIEQNYPPENYTMLREALDYCLEMLKGEIKGAKNELDKR